jgi:alanyl-tRNA synthetase
LESKTGVFKVTNTKKFCNEIIAHEGEVLSGHFQNSDRVELRVDREKRQKIRANHTATHLLHAALRIVLGEHVVQRGSFLNEDRLRFDFSHNSAVSHKDILEIEKFVNGWILQDLPVICSIMSQKEAVSAGAMALFGEKYGDSVRTVSIATENAGKISFELCGGTHVLSTGRIGLFKILSESSIGSGIRRMEAITGEKILEHLGQTEEIVDSLSEKLKCNGPDLLDKVENLLIELKQKNQKILLEKQRSSLEKIQEFSKIDAKVYTLVVSGHTMDELRSLNDFIRSQKSSGIIIIANCDGNKVSLVVGVSSDLQNKYNAGQLLRCGLSILDGKGGGSAALAQGGGEGKDKVTQSVELIVNSIN